MVDWTVLLLLDIHESANVDWDLPGPDVILSLRTVSLPLLGN